MLKSNESQVVALIHGLRKLPKETEWLEFKHNDGEPQEIGEYISALSNSAALEGQSTGYVIWGIDNNTHEVVGTTFDPDTTKKGNEDLESWLLRLLQPASTSNFTRLGSMISQ